MKVQWPLLHVCQWIVEWPLHEYGWGPDTYYYMLLLCWLPWTTCNCLELIVLYSRICPPFFLYLLSLVLYYLSHLETFFPTFINVYYICCCKFSQSSVFSYTVWIYLQLKWFISSSYRNIYYILPRKQHCVLVYIHVYVMSLRDCLQLFQGRIHPCTSAQHRKWVLFISIFMTLHELSQGS